MEVVLYGLWCIIAAPISLIIGYYIGRKESLKKTKELAKTFEYLANKLTLKLGLAEIEIEELRGDLEHLKAEKRRESANK